MGRKPKNTLKLEMPFEEALERFIRVDPTELLDRSLRSKKITPETAKRRKDVSKTKKPAHSMGLKKSRSAGAGTKKKGEKP